MSEPWCERLGEESETLTHDHSLGSDAVYFLETFERHGIELAFEKLGVEGVHVGLEARYIHLSTVLSLHFVPETKDRSETQPISLAAT